MTDQKFLTILTEARSVLAESYIKWYLQDSKGGHCAAGSVLHKADDMPHYLTVMDKLNAVAKQLHPELTGQSAPRKDPLGIYNPLAGAVQFSRDYFDSHPVVYVNNHLGKEAVLAVFDAAILDVELKLASAVVPEEVPEQEYATVVRG